MARSVISPGASSLARPSWKISWISARMARPPAPYFIVISSSRTDSPTAPSQIRMSTVLMPDAARAFAADHARAHRRVRHALAAVERTIAGRFDARHDVAADAVADQRRRREI